MAAWGDYAAHNGRQRQHGNADDDDDDEPTDDDFCV